MFSQEIKNAMAERYFLRKTRKVFIDRGYNPYRAESFEKYLAHRYRDNCYYYSAYAIMGLKNNDYLVRGDIKTEGDWFWENGSYAHGWVEFTYRGEEYVFDSMRRYIFPKKVWYDKTDPKNELKMTKREILNSFLTPDKSVQLRRGHYKVREMIDNGDDTVTINPLSEAHIYMLGNKVRKFIAYCEPSG